MDTVFLRGLKCQAIIGIWEWERRLKQQLVLDIELATDVTAAAEGDDLERAINYQRVAERVREVTESSSFKLVESLCEALASMLLEEFAIKWVRVRIDKGKAVEGVDHVGVEIERQVSNS